VGAGYGLEVLKTLRDLVADPKSDLFDVLEYVSFCQSYSSSSTKPFQMLLLSLEVLTSSNRRSRNSKGIFILPYLPRCAGN